MTLLGSSGSGKATLLKFLAGFQSIDSGEVLIVGKAIGHAPTHKWGFGMVFQAYAIFPNMVVNQNIRFSNWVSGL
ncbi:ATP-binding cassette domain-containing protein [Pseudorhodobacter turbinis]|uniref:ATP-binding cassette domain-containing protein n=1 Tax=Pseudorhodobacter turbinis TaxID=2500533 RepID=UPI001F0F6C12|nr:ATP-binding cassette domain-containing protein [Pseudorhodobacter turbinis]